MKKPPKNELETLYNSGQSFSQIAKIYNTSGPTIRSWLLSYDIKLRTHREASNLANISKVSIPSKEVFKALYDDYSILELQRIFNVGQQTIYSWLEYHSIPQKQISDACSHRKKIRQQTRLEKWTNIGKDYEDSGYNLSTLKTQYKCCNNTLMKAFEIHGVEKKPFIRSQYESLLFKDLQQIYPGWVNNNRSIIFPQELDLIHPILKIAIEVCGLYWHSEGFGGKSSRYHKDKLIKAKDAGYDLITLFETDLIFSYERTLNFIKMKCGEVIRIGARETLVKVISPKEAHDFEKRFHFMGSAGAKVFLALEHKGEIVSVVSFDYSRFDKHHQWELVRYTVSSNITVLGGFAKLLKYFIRNHNPQSIITYADRRYGEGKIYLREGFKFIRETAPNYWYFKKNVVQLHSRQKFQKHKLSTLLETYNPEMTEYQNMKINGYDRIWDCGSNVYSLTI